MPSPSYRFKVITGIFMVSLALCGCDTPPPPDPDLDVVRTIHTIRDRIGFAQPGPSSDPARQKEVLGWFIGQLSPGTQVPKDWLNHQDGIQAALEGNDLSFPRWAAAHMPTPRSRPEVLEAWINADLLQADPHSRYLPPAQAVVLDKILRIYDEGLGLAVEEYPASPGLVKITSISPNSPSEKKLTTDGLLVSWKSSGGEWSTPENAKNWGDILAGKTGSRIGLRWMPHPGDPVKEVWLTRSLWTIEGQRVTGNMIIAKGIKLGVVRIPAFYDQRDGISTVADVTAARDRLRKLGAKVLVLDLRGNPGGFWDQALLTAGAFAPGALVAVASPRLAPGIPINAPDSPDPWTGPVWIWVDRNTASASEVLAGFLRETVGACVIGERTFGKGSIQVLSSLSAPFGNGKTPGQLALTTMLYRWKSGNTPQKWGIAPDLWMFDPAQTLQTGERALPDGLPSGPQPKEPPPIRFAGHPDDWVGASQQSPACRS
jgi:C-terminal peptidase prc